MKSEIKPYSVGELAVLYTINRKTFKKWLMPHETKIGKRRGYYYNIKQVRIIFDALGTPGDSMEAA